MQLHELDFDLGAAINFHDELNTKLFEDNKLRPEVRKQLMVIADDFKEELEIPDSEVEDLTISGSNAAYSYSKHSDLDLHLIVDIAALPNSELQQKLFNARKSLYNQSHDLKIRGIPVELYVQDSAQPHVSLGIYSVKNDEWIKEPVKTRANLNQTATKAKYEKLKDLIELAERARSLELVLNIMDTLKRYRKAGLTETGEFGPENLAFKVLRSQGYIDRLYDLRDELHSERLSIESLETKVS